MAGLRVEQFVVGPVMTNCYFAVQTDTAEALVVDPGDEAERLIGKLKERGFSVAAVLRRVRWRTPLALQFMRMSWKKRR